MRQTTPPPPPCTPEKKLRFMELNAELRDLKSMESLTYYEYEIVFYWKRSGNTRVTIPYDSHKDLLDQ